jgi:PPOX class probable FMN-dependent enzyme
MATITTLDQLRALYGKPGERALKKQIPALEAHSLRFIALSPFVVVASHGADGSLDASPRGGAPGFVKAAAGGQLLLPDSPGNNRLDTLENVVATGRVGLLFLIPGVDETLRVNGRAQLSTDEADIAACTDERRAPRLAIRVQPQAVYLHCAKAFMRSKLWRAEAQIDPDTLPTIGQMIADQAGLAIAPESREAMLQRYAPDL